MKEMQDEDFVGFKPGYGLRYMFDLMCRDLNIHPHLAFEGEEVSTILGLTAAGLEPQCCRKPRSINIFRSFFFRWQITNANAPLR